MTAADWLALAGICFAGAVSPGPSLALVLRHSLVSPRAGLACAWAHAAGIGVYAALAVSGLALVFTTRPELRLLVTVAGALWLLWLARRLWLAPADWETAAAAGGSPLVDGFAMALVNPKVALFFVAVFTPFLPAAPRLSDQIGLTALAAGIDGAWYGAVALGLSRGPVLQWLRRRAGLINRISATVFIALAGSLLLAAGGPT